MLNYLRRLIELLTFDRAEGIPLKEFDLLISTKKDPPKWSYFDAALLETFDTVRKIEELWTPPWASICKGLRFLVSTAKHDQGG